MTTKTRSQNRVLVDYELFLKLKSKATEEGKPMSAIVAEGLKLYFGQDDKDKSN